MVAHPTRRLTTHSGRRKEIKFSSEDLKKENILKTIQKHPSAIKQFPDRSVSFMRKAIKANHAVISYFTEEERDNKELMLIAVKEAGHYGFQFVSRRLRNDQDVALAAIKKDSVCFHYISQQLKKNENFLKKVEKLESSSSSKNMKSDSGGNFFQKTMNMISRFI